MVNEWTREDLPDRYDLQRLKSGIVQPFFFDDILDAVVEHLNANHQKPTPGLLSNAADCVLGAEDRVSAAKSDADRWRRAHEIVEGERDQARRERDKWEEKYLDTDEALHRARASLHEACKVAQSYKVDAYQATERAEAAEARTAPAVTKRELRSVVAAHDPGDDELAVSRVNALTDRLWSLVSGADPAVHVVRESEVAAVEVTRDFGGWCADGAWVAGVDDTAEWVRGRAAEMVVYAARSEAVARAIEAGQAADPLLDKAQEFAALADWALTDREAELLHTVAAHVLGQEVK